MGEPNPTLGARLFTTSLCMVFLPYMAVISTIDKVSEKASDIKRKIKKILPHKNVEDTIRNMYE